MHICTEITTHSLVYSTSVAIILTVYEMHLESKLRFLAKERKFFIYCHIGHIWLPQAFVPTLPRNWLRSTFICVTIYRASQEDWTKLRESVP